MTLALKQYYTLMKVARCVYRCVELSYKFKLELSVVCGMGILTSISSHFQALASAPIIVTNFGIQERDPSP